MSSSRTRTSTSPSPSRLARPPALAERLKGAGWSRVAWRNLTGGVVALHRGFKES
ncbi:hypothetical protein GCM10019016_094800 [Streptomyces prasinosporus]|uniref:Uncharacterized protein n=1 Tax=Streptomyces prasinosporus TaxID=68256 RepID=A0ABP6U3X6_9ACTN